MIDDPRRSAGAPARMAAGLLLPAALMLSACGSESTVESRKGAAGEILPGSASDAMISLDTLRSQAPLAPRAVSSGSGGGQTGEQAPGDTAAVDAAGDAGPAAVQGGDPAPGSDVNATPAAE